MSCPVATSSTCTLPQQPRAEGYPPQVRVSPLVLLILIRFSPCRTKKFLKKQQLRDWLRIVSTSRGVYELKFYNVVNDEADEDED
jgi:hypothetical protein